MAESKEGGDFYDRAYDGARPEIFLKRCLTGVVGPNQKVAIRDDSNWSVPEPELAVLIIPQAKVLDYTIADDMSSRDMEGQNPLYSPLANSTEIKMEIFRAGKPHFREPLL